MPNFHFDDLFSCFDFSPESIIEEDTHEISIPNGFEEILEVRDGRTYIKSSNVYNGCEVLLRPVKPDDFVVLSSCNTNGYPIRRHFTEDEYIGFSGGANSTKFILNYLKKDFFSDTVIDQKFAVPIVPTPLFLEYVVSNINSVLNRHSATIIIRELIKVIETQYAEYLEIIDIPCCSVCGKKTLDYNEAIDGKVCYSCYNKIYASCCECGMTFKRDEYSECSDGRHLCQSCQKREFVLPYHSMYPKLSFFGDNKDNSVPYLGVELEVDEGGENNSSVKKILRVFNKNKDIFAYCSHDGSLNNGFEIITQPATYEYHTSIKDVYSNVFNILRQNGYLSHDTSTCGLHVHFNRNFYGDNEEVYISHLLYLIDKFWNDVVVFSRRNQYRIDRYSKKIEGSEIQTYINRTNKSGSHESHYYAINIANRDTIEFRMFKGTLNINTFLATLQFVNACIMVAKEKSAEEIQRMSFEELLTGRLTKKYWKRRIGIDGTEE